MSDHFSGPRAIADPAADIADLYVFPSPERPGRLVLVMTVFPAAMPCALFSDAVAYRFRLRPVTLTDTGARPVFEVGQTQHYGIDVRGGTGTFGYYISANHTDDEGFSRNMFHEQTALRVNANAEVMDNLRLSSGLGYVRGLDGKPNDIGSFAIGFFEQIYFGTPFNRNDPKRRGFLQSTPEETAEIEKIPEDVRHLALHEGHLVEVSALDRRHIAPELGALTLSGTEEQLRERLKQLEAAGLTEILYQPCGPDIPRELEAFAEAARS